jgi:hypothetical protein
MVAATVFAAPAAAQPPSDTAAPVKLLPRRTAATAAQVAGKASNPRIAGPSDCATVRANLKVYAKQGKKTVSCVTVKDHAGKRPANHPKAGVSAVWCEELGGDWRIRRNGACQAFKEIGFILIRLPDEVVIGTATTLVSQQIDLANNSTMFTEYPQAAGGTPGARCRCPSPSARRCSAASTTAPRPTRRVSR